MWTFSKTVLLLYDNTPVIFSNNIFNWKSQYYSCSEYMLNPEFNVVWNHSVFWRLREITADLATVAAEDKEQSICSLIAGHVPLLIWQTKECSHACSAMHSNWQ